MVKRYLISAREKSRKFRREFRNQAIIAIIAAFGFLIALSWRDFISDSVNQIVESLGVTDKVYLYKLLSAIAVTLLAILGIMIMSRLKVHEEIQEKTKENPKESKRK